MKKNLQRFGASVLAAAMVAQSVALPAAAETTKIDSSVAQSVAASAASAASAVQSLPKFTSTADLIKQTAQTLAAQGEVHELEQDDAKLEATAQSKAGMICNTRIGGKVRPSFCGLPGEHPPGSVWHYSCSSAALQFSSSAFASSESTGYSWQLFCKASSTISLTR